MLSPWLLSAPEMTSSVRLLSEISRLLSLLDEISAFVIAEFEASMLLDAELKSCSIVSFVSFVQFEMSRFVSAI